MRDDFCLLTASEAATLIRERKLSPVELTEAYLARIEALQPQLDAFITVTAETAREQARQAEREIGAGDYRGPLHGIPFGLKDIYDTAGIRTTGHSRLCADNVPTGDATCWRRLREGGAVLLGKLATHEFAHGGPAFDLPWPPARNPWNLEHFTGGSSSGSGAATAAGLVAAALGTDTGGSIRMPAAMCGITGMIATSGLVSRAGVIPNSFTFDHCGPMARSARDCALVLQQIAGYDPRDGGSIEAPPPDYQAALRERVSGMRVGVLRHVWEEDLPQPDEVCRAMDEAISCLQKLGVQVRDVRARPALEYNDVKVVIGETEIFCVHHRDLIERPGDFCEDILTRMLAGVLFQGVEYVQASREHRRMIHELAPLRGEVDALLSTIVGPAPRLDAHDSLNFWARPNASAMANVLGGPAIALPNGFTRSGLPLGMQLIGFPLQEAAVLRLAHAYQQATDWHQRRPPLVPGVPQPPITPHPPAPGANDLTQAEADLVCALARKAKLRLNERQTAILLSAAPYALAMAGRVRRMHERSAEPANTFHVLRCLDQPPSFSASTKRTTN